MPVKFSLESKLLRPRIILSTNMGLLCISFAWLFSPDHLTPGFEHTQNIETSGGGPGIKMKRIDYFWPDTVVYVNAILQQRILNWDMYFILYIYSKYEDMINWGCLRIT
jgi:hypothetical protein